MKMSIKNLLKNKTVIHVLATGLIFILMILLFLLSSFLLGINYSELELKCILCIISTFTIFLSILVAIHKSRNI